MVSSERKGQLRALSPIRLRGLDLKNRLAVSPMCTYSAVGGMMDDFHLVHLGRFALGAAGLVMAEATAVSEQGRITHGCLGLWRDEQVEPARRVTDFLHRFGCAAGVQLSHAGYKSSTQRPWHGGVGLGPVDRAERGEDPWQTAGVTDAPFDTGWPTPRRMSSEDLRVVSSQFAEAARRADAAGYDLIELHCAHGYLLHSFLSPLSNTRTDQYGGSLESRMRFPLEVTAAVRAAWPEDKPIFVRVSSVDGIDVGWSLADTVTFAKRLKAIGIDAIDCSSGGMKLERQQNFVWRGPGFHLSFSEQVRREAEIPTVAVGLITEAEQAEAILASGQADLIFVGREALMDPNWAARWALGLTGAGGWRLWPERFGWWLERRSRQRKDRYAIEPAAAPE